MSSNVIRMVKRDVLKTRLNRKPGYLAAIESKATGASDRFYYAEPEHYAALSVQFANPKPNPVTVVVTGTSAAGIYRVAQLVRLSNPGLPHRLVVVGVKGTPCDIQYDSPEGVVGAFKVARDMSTDMGWMFCLTDDVTHLPSKWLVAAEQALASGVDVFAHHVKQPNAIRGQFGAPRLVPAAFGCTLDAFDAAIAQARSSNALAGERTTNVFCTSILANGNYFCAEAADTIALSTMPAGHDVVITLGRGSPFADTELRYALRSIAANLKDCRHVVLIGHKPDWVTGVQHVRYPDMYTDSKDSNLIGKLLRVTELGVSDDFMFWSDDQLLLRPSLFAEIRPAYLRDYDPNDALYRRSKWHERLKATIERVKHCTATPRYFEPHRPQPINATSLRYVARRFPWQTNHGCIIYSYYYNAIGEPGVRLNDHVFIGAGTEAEMASRMSNARFAAYTDDAANAGLFNVLQTRFPAPCRFELC